MYGGDIFFLWNPGLGYYVGGDPRLGKCFCLHEIWVVVMALVVISSVSSVWSPWPTSHIHVKSNLKIYSTCFFSPPLVSLFCSMGSVKTCGKWEQTKLMPLSLIWQTCRMTWADKAKENRLTELIPRRFWSLDNHDIQALQKSLPCFSQKCFFFLQILLWGYRASISPLRLADTAQRQTRPTRSGRCCPFQWLFLFSCYASYVGSGNFSN